MSTARELPGTFMTAQHHAIDRGVDGALDGSGTAAVLAEALALLRAHIHLEETMLFPSLAEEGLAMPVFVMLREHGQMWPLIERLEAACAAGADVAALQQADVLNLRQQLNIHNPKEEQIVYTAADQRADADGDPVAELAAARLPDGWRCRTAPR